MQIVARIGEAMVTAIDDGVCTMAFAAVCCQRKENPGKQILREALAVETAIVFVFY